MRYRSTMLTKILTVLTVLSTSTTVVLWAGTPFQPVPQHHADQLRGGGWCMEHVQAGGCDECETFGVSFPQFDFKCDTTGTLWDCGDSPDTTCKRCILGEDEPRGGDFYIYEPESGCDPTKLTGVLEDECQNLHNGLAYSSFAEGTCPNNCPDWL